MAEPIRVLLIEDEPLLSRFMIRLLGTWALDVDSAGTLAEALARLATEHYAAIILDLRLPDSEDAGRTVAAPPRSYASGWGSWLSTVTSCPALRHSRASWRV